MNPNKIYPREGNNGTESVYLKSVVTDGKSNEAVPLRPL